jgi:2-polyprenyl-3-methyl-5-hydroxy-6-metoxy-1,4-benzoquinol methylase
MPSISFFWNARAAKSMHIVVPPAYKEVAMPFSLKQTGRLLCPPVFWNALQWCRRTIRQASEPSPPARGHTVSTLEELDAAIERIRPLSHAGRDCATFISLLNALSFQLPNDLPADPFSREYHNYQMAFYKLMSGCNEYRADVCEQAVVNDDKRQRPFPYYTRSSTIVGEQLMAIGFTIRASGTKPEDHVLEFGPGFGRLTLELARLGLDVTAVEINPSYVELVRELTLREGLHANIQCSGMLDYVPTQRFDRVFFYECFHHCSDHAAMIAKLDSLVAPGGAVVFAGEPITDDFPMPWGVRRDGQSLWAIRMHRWLELGFRTDYFLAMLARHGWVAEIHNCVDVPWQRVFVARRAAE